MWTGGDIIWPGITKIITNTKNSTRYSFQFTMRCFWCPAINIENHYYYNMLKNGRRRSTLKTEKNEENRLF